MKLIDLDQRVIVLVIDETRGGIQYEMQMSIGELLKKALEDFEPEIIEAVPVEWLEVHSKKYCVNWGTRPGTVEDALKKWRKEQEART